MLTRYLSARVALSGAALSLLVVAAAPGCGAEECHSDCEQPATSSSGSGAGGNGVSALTLSYCDCMLVSCHDAYHVAFGPETDEVAARNNCIAEAETLPVAGSEVETGDFIECRIHHCELGKTDDTACPASVGDAVCTP